MFRRVLPAFRGPQGRAKQPWTLLLKSTRDSRGRGRATSIFDIPMPLPREPQQVRNRHLPTETRGGGVALCSKQRARPGGPTQACAADDSTDYGGGLICIPYFAAVAAIRCISGGPLGGGGSSLLFAGSATSLKNLSMPPGE